MGNKSSKTRQRARSGKPNKAHQHLIIESARPEHVFMNSDNSLCILVDAEGYARVYEYCASQHQFKERFAHNFAINSSKLNLDNIIFEPFHQTLFVWRGLCCQQVTFHSTTKAFSDDEKKGETRTVISALEQHKYNVQEWDTQLSDSDKIVHVHPLYRGDLVLLAVDNGTLIAMKKEEETSECKYAYVRSFAIPNCGTINGIAFHEKRAKMCLLSAFNEHWYLNLYSIGQMLLSLMSETLSDADDDGYNIIAATPKLTVCRLVYERPANCNAWGSLLAPFKTRAQGNKHGGHIGGFKAGDGALYMRSVLFGINPDKVSKLLFSPHGDKILYQATSGTKLHHQHFGRNGHSPGHQAGWLNDFGRTHLIDANTGNSLWNTGESAQSEGVAWTLNDYLLVLNKCLPCQCSFNLEGFESETMIAECLHGDVIASYGALLSGFVWDLCLLIAEFRGAPDRWYREISLCKCDDKNEIRLMMNAQPTRPLNAFSTPNHRWVIVTVGIGAESKGKQEGQELYNQYETHFFEAQPIAQQAFGEDDVLIRFTTDNAIISRNLYSRTDVFGTLFRDNQTKWFSK